MPADSLPLGGLVLWSRAFTPTFETLANTPNSPINVLVKSAFIEGKAMTDGEEQGLEKDGYSVRWSVDNGLGLVFVVRNPHYWLSPLLFYKLISSQGGIPCTSSSSVRSGSFRAYQDIIPCPLPALCRIFNRISFLWRCVRRISFETAQGKDCGREMG